MYSTLFLTSQPYMNTKYVTISVTPGMIEKVDGILLDKGSSHVPRGGNRDVKMQRLSRPNVLLNPRWRVRPLAAAAAEKPRSHFLWLSLGSSMRRAGLILFTQHTGKGDATLLPIDVGLHWSFLSRRLRYQTMIGNNRLPQTLPWVAPSLLIIK